MEDEENETSSCPKVKKEKFERKKRSKRRVNYLKNVVRRRKGDTRIDCETGKVRKKKKQAH